MCLCTEEHYATEGKGLACEEMEDLRGQGPNRRHTHTNIKSFVSCLFNSRHTAMNVSFPKDVHTFMLTLKDPLISLPVSLSISVTIWCFEFERNTVCERVHVSPVVMESK